MPLKAKGHAGHVLSIRDEATPFPLKAEISIGDTSAKFEGTLTGLVGFKGIDLQFEQLSGKSMEELYWIIGLAFPDTSPYRLSGRLYRANGTWLFENFSGKVGESDLAGTLQIETGKDKRPFMHGDLTSKVLNFADLGPLVGTKEPRESGVLPDMPFSPERWESVDADVKITAGTVKRPEQLPIDKFGTRILLRDRVLTLDPLGFGIAGGRLIGTVRLDGTKEPMRGDVKMRVQQPAAREALPDRQAGAGLDRRPERAGRARRHRRLGRQAARLGERQDRRLHGRGQDQPLPDGAGGARPVGRGAHQAERRPGHRDPLRHRRLRREGRHRADQRLRLRHHGDQRHRRAAPST